MRIATIALVVACSSQEPHPRERVAPVVESVRTVDAGVAASRGATLDAAVAMTDIVVRDGCADTVQGKRFRGARILCLAIATLTLASVALEDPRRAEDIASRIDALVVHALSAGVRAPFAGTGVVRIADHELPGSILYRGLLGMMLVAHHRVFAAPSRWLSFADALAASVAGDLEHGFVRSYRDGIWLCDHAPAASFLRLHGK